MFNDELTKSLFHGLFEDLNHIFVMQHMGQSNFLGTEFDTTTPDGGIGKLLEQVFMNLQDGGFHIKPISALGQNNWITEIRLTSWSLSVYSDEAKLIPDLIHEDVNSKFHLD